MDEPDAVGGLSDRSLLSLCPDLRSTGPSRWVPLRYVGEPEEPCVLAPSTALPEWAQALERGMVARWRVGQGEYTGWARRLSEADPAYRATVDRYATEFGAQRLQRWFSGQAACFQLMSVPPDAASDPRSVEAFFDAAASEYDHVVQGNRIDAWLRQESVAVLKAAFRPGQRVLELGCGTGLETIPLAQAGVDVLAIDVSSEMLRRLEEKARALGVSERIQVHKGSASGIHTLIHEIGPGSFDGAFSDFGALNLDPDWPAVSRSLATLVREDGRLVLGVWNRTCLMEMALYALVLRPARALSRLRSPVPPGRSRFPLPVRAYSPGPFLATLAPAFRLESIQALPVLLPPYDLLPHVPAADRLLPLMESADRTVRGRFPFNRLGDHFLAQLQRTGA